MGIVEPVRTIVYRFRFADGDERAFTVRLDPRTLAIVDPPREDLPDWTRLDFCRCANCPLDPSLHPRCPIAARVVDVLEAFRNRTSFEEVDVTVVTERRTYQQHTSIQKGLSSLLGIYNVASGCPVMNKLRPMLDSHLPFASNRETTFRTISMYMMAQFFRGRWGKDPDFRLTGLEPLLEQVRAVDVGLGDRLAALGFEDASLNALVILTGFGDDVTFTLSEQDLARWDEIFQEHYG